MKNRFYYSAQQESVLEAEGSQCSYVWNGSAWLKYTEWCSDPEDKSNWEDAALVFETDDYPRVLADPTKAAAETWSLASNLMGETAEPEVDSEVKCSCCGKVIPKGADLYKVHGYTYYCCSAECLLDAMVPTAYVKRCSGHYDED